MAKKKSTRKKATTPSQKPETASGTPKKKKATKRAPVKKKAVKRATRASKKKKAPVKKRRPRSRGARRNAKTAPDHATNQVESVANGTEQPSDPHVEPPESFRPGPSVQLLDGTDSVNRERQVIQQLLDHDEWQIPEIAFSSLPNRLTAMALNIGDVRDADGNVTQQNVPDAGNWSTNQQLTAMRIIERFHAHNLKKLTALKPNEVRVLNEQSTVVTVEDQRLAVLAAITAELSRRQSGGTSPDRPAGFGIGNSVTRAESTASVVSDQDEG